MWATILGILQGLLQAIPIIDRWFKKTQAQKDSEVDAENQKAKDKAKETGRPV